MKKRNIVCKNLSNLETLGTINVLCSDKTGTLTENRMSVANCAILTQVKTPHQAHAVIIEQRNAHAWRQLWHVTSLSSTVSWGSETGSLRSNLMSRDATDQAILQFAEILSPVAPLYSKWRQILKIPFHPKNKAKISPSLSVNM
jgi:sodium/potassium-transporting ATPase subunit alpha